MMRRSTRDLVLQDYSRQTGIEAPLKGILNPLYRLPPTLEEERQEDEEGAVGSNGEGEDGGGDEVEMGRLGEASPLTTLGKVAVGHILLQVLVLPYIVDPPWVKGMMKRLYERPFTA